MTDQIPEVALLSIIETQQAQPIKLDFREDRERTSETSLVLKGGDTFLVADARGDFLSSRQEMGVFSHGTRFLRTCNLYLEGCRLVGSRGRRRVGIGGLRRTSLSRHCQDVFHTRTFGHG